eukprot:4155833-Amphidinium_carterae.1
MRPVLGGHELPTAAVPKHCQPLVRALTVTGGIAFLRTSTTCQVVTVTYHIGFRSRQPLLSGTC